MVRHLPTSIKHLLLLRNPHPLPGPSGRKLQDLFTDTFHEARSRRAETGWLVLATCSLLTLNRPAAVAELYRFITTTASEGEQARDKHINKAAIMRESALKSTIFVGVPRVILSLTALNEVLQPEVRAALRRKSRRVTSAYNIESTIERGRALWDSIYQPHADKLHDKLGSYHPDFISFIIQSYGSVLSPLPGRTKSFDDDSSANDPDQGNISRAQGSVVGIACLRAEDRVVPQLMSHVFGLLKARYVPDLSEEDMWLASDEGTEWILRTVDQFLDGVPPELAEGTNIGRNSGSTKL